MVKKFHIQASGAEAGSLVLCRAEVNCRLGAESEHMYFSTPAQAKECSELLAAESSGGAFGGGLSGKEAQRLSELRAVSELNRAKLKPSLPGDMYLSPHTDVERSGSTERRIGSNLKSRGTAPATISKRITGELETAQIGGYLSGVSRASASVKNGKLGKEVRVDLEIARGLSDSHSKELQRRARQVAESFTESSYALSSGKLEQTAGDRISIELSYRENRS